MTHNVHVTSMGEKHVAAKSQSPGARCCSTDWELRGTIQLEKKKKKEWGSRCKRGQGTETLAFERHSPSLPSIPPLPANASSLESTPAVWIFCWNVGGCEGFPEFLSATFFFWISLWAYSPFRVQTCFFRLTSCLDLARPLFPLLPAGHLASEMRLLFLAS